MSLSKHVDKRAIPLASMIDPDTRRIWVVLTQKGERGLGLEYGGLTGAPLSSHIPKILTSRKYGRPIRQDH